MAVTYTYAVRYEVEAICRTPLRTGGTDGDPETILEGGDGTALLQASSLAGALRGWLESGQNTALAEVLFGSPKMAGHLLMSDGVFEKAAERFTRPRLRINGETGTADEGGKFDVAHIGSGSIIAAGAVVLSGMEVPPNSLVAGVPGKILRRDDPHSLERTRDNSQEYILLAEGHAESEDLT